MTYNSTPLSCVISVINLLTCNLQCAGVQQGKARVPHLKLDVVLVPADRWRRVACRQARQQCQTVHR